MYTEQIWPDMVARHLPSNNSANRRGATTTLHTHTAKHLSKRLPEIMGIDGSKLKKSNLRCCALLTAYGKVVHRVLHSTSWDQYGQNRLLNATTRQGHTQGAECGGGQAEARAGGAERQAGPCLAVALVPAVFGSRRRCAGHLVRVLLTQAPPHVGSRSASMQARINTSNRVSSFELWRLKTSALAETCVDLTGGLAWYAGGDGDAGTLLMPWMPSVASADGGACDVRVTGFGKTVQVFSSKQLPKKLEFFGDDFRSHYWIIKV